MDDFETIASQIENPNMSVEPEKFMPEGLPTEREPVIDLEKESRKKSMLAEMKSNRDVRKQEMLAEMKTNRESKNKSNMISANLEAKGVPQSFMSKVGKGALNVLKAPGRFLEGTSNTMLRLSKDMDKKVMKNVLKPGHELLMGGAKDFGTMGGRMGGNFAALEQSSNY